MSGLDINDYIEKAKRLTTPEISDALDYFSLPGSLLGIKHIAGKNAFVGTMPGRSDILPSTGTIWAPSVTLSMTLRPETSW